LKPNGKVDYSRDSRDAETLLTCLNNGKRRVNADKVFRFRTYGDVLRAMLSSDYAPVDNSWYIETLSELLPNGRVSHWRGNADTIWGNILIPDSIRQEDDSDYGGMVSIGNCEIGIRVVEQYPSLFRAICMNGCIWDQTSGYHLRRVHRGRSLNLDSLRVEMKDNINKQIPLVDSVIINFLRLRERKIEAPLKQVFVLMAEDWKLQKSELPGIVNAFVDFESDNKSAFGMVNAITRFGQTLEPARWFEFDNIGGAISKMDEKKWNNFNERAKMVEKEKIEKWSEAAAV
jgi:hypothetical protein